MADIKELSRNPLNPRHPFFITDAQTIRYTPYALFGGLFLRLTGLDILTAYWFICTFNLMLFLGGVYFFSESFFESQKASPYFLVTLLFFAPNTFIYVNNWSISSIVHIAGYSSFFVFALSFWVFPIFFRINKHSKFDVGVALILSAIIVSTHLLTAFFYFICCILFLFQKNRENFILGVGVLVLAVFISFLWPYYSVSEFILSQTKEASSKSLLPAQGVSHNSLPQYFNFPQNIPTIGLTILLGFLFSIRSLTKKHNLTYLLGSSFFFLAYLLPQLGLASIPYWHRMMFFGLFFLILSLTDFFIEKNVFSPGKWRANLRNLRQNLGDAKNTLFSEYPHFLLDFLLLFYFISMFFVHIESVFIQSVNNDGDIDLCELSFITEYVEPYDKVLSDRNTSWFIPLFSGKIVGYSRSNRYLGSSIMIPERNNDVDMFFNKNTSNQQRQNILSKYNVSFLLLKNKQTNISDHLNEQVIEQTDNFRLIKIT